MTTATETKLIDARCLYCRTRATVECSPREAGRWGILNAASPFKAGLIWRLEKHYSGCCDECSRKFDSGEKTMYAI